MNQIGTVDGQTATQTRHAALEAALSAIDESRRPAVLERLEHVPAMREVGYARSAAGLLSPRRAIFAFCLQCISYEPGEVRRCTATACPLFCYREAGL